MADHDSDAVVRNAVPDPVLALAEFCEAEASPANLTLFRQDQRPSVLWYIQSGLVKTIRRVGEDEAFISARGPGWILGLAPAFLNARYTTSGITARPAVLRPIQPQALLAALRESAGLAGAILERVLVQARQDEVQRAEMAVCAAPDRLNLALIRLARMVDAPRRRGHVELALPITHSELAQWVGISPQHMHRLLDALERSGMLVRRKGVLLLPLEHWPGLLESRPHHPR